MAIGWSVVFAMLATACQQPVSREAQPDRFAPLDIEPAAKVLRIDPDSSQLIVRVYRDGRLAHLGHNHVVSSKDLRGEVYLADKLYKSALEVRLPVATLDVDDPQLRQQAGEDFPGELDGDAIAGTRANMLGDQQLNAADWPEIIIRSRGIEGVLPNLEMLVDVAVQTHVHRLVVPVDVSLNGSRLVASAEFSVNQSDLGLQPFSVMMGALKVRDRLDITLIVTAVLP